MSSVRFLRSPLAALVALAALLCATAGRLPADSGKTLENRRGDVSYQVGRGPAVAVARSASVSVDDGAVAATGPGSEGAVVLPDSSQVLLGSDTRVQLAFFNQSQIATARFVIYQGKTRFEVRHPRGAQANYTFSTPTGQIAVRGTTGDIESVSGQMRVNVYELSDPSLRVQVTTLDGRSFTLGAGDSLFAHYVNGVLQVDVNKVTQQAMAAFKDDFGPPPGPGKPGGGGKPNGPSSARNGATSAGKRPLTESLFAFIAVIVGVGVLAASFFWRGIVRGVNRTRYLAGNFPMTEFCRRRLSERQIDPRLVGQVLIHPKRSRTRRNGRRRYWAFIQERGMWLRVVTLPNGTVHDAFFDKGFKFEDRVRSR